MLGYVTRDQLRVYMVQAVCSGCSVHESPALYQVESTKRIREYGPSTMMKSDMQPAKIRGNCRADRNKP